MSLETLSGERVAERAREASVNITQLYFNDIESYPLLTKKQEVDLGRQVQAGIATQTVIIENPSLAIESEFILNSGQDAGEIIKIGREAEKSMAKANLRLVISIAKRRVKKDSSLDLLDIVQEGNFGLMHAVTKFNPEKGFKFSTYATYWIKQSIGRGIQYKEELIRVPKHIQDKMDTISETRRFLQKEGEKFDDEAVAEFLDMPISELKQTKAAVDIGRVTSISSEISMPSTRIPVTVESVTSDPKAAEQFEQVEKEIASEQIRKLISYTRFEGIEREVIDLRFSENPLSYGEIGKKLGRKPHLVRSIALRALLKVRRTAEKLNLSYEDLAS